DGGCISRFPSRAMAEASRHRLLQLSRGADKCSEAGRVPFPCHPSLVAHAAAAKPERLDDDGTDRAVGRGLAPETAHPPSLARCTLRRQTPEVGAVCSNWARTDLSGGREATRVPTAIMRCNCAAWVVHDPERTLGLPSNIENIQNGAIWCFFA